MSSEYEFNEREKYWGIRENHPDIAFDGFDNSVYFNDDDKTVTIQVDSQWEFDDYDPNDVDDIDFDLELECDYPFSEKFIMENKNDFIYRDVFHLSVRKDDLTYNHDYKMNWYSNMDITFPVGEGILDYCYTDFTQHAKSLGFSMLLVEKFKESREQNYEVPTFHNADEKFRYEQDCIDSTMRALSDYIYQSVYSGAFPPYIDNVKTVSLKRYAWYIRNIQDEMKRRIEFVFDDEFYPDELSKLTAYERFALYSDIYDIPRSFERTERFSVKMTTDNTTLKSTLIPIDDICKRLSSFEPSTEKSPLEKALNLKKDYVQLHYHVPSFIAIGYDCNSIHDMLELEFSKMLEYGIKLHKCKNCGRYFIVKGNYGNDYCDRIREGQTKNCQQIAAQKNYEEKLQNNQAVALFRKYYKRYYARTKVGTIKPDKFRQWNYKACEMRDNCLNGVISIEEFECFLRESFSNREKK